MENANYDFRILVIDDNVEIHKDFLNILTANTTHDIDALGEKLFQTSASATNQISLPQFKIDTATQGQEGTIYIENALLEKEPYSLAFVDIRMPPGWDGVETIKKIWSIDPDIHVVICTAHSDYSWEETIDELGHSDNFLILKKPFDYMAVRQLAFALTRKWKLLQESRSHLQNLEKKIAERTDQLKYQATHDVLTGLPNRMLLIDKINEAIALNKKTGHNFAIVFFDLDRFKLVNDSLGHPTGDELLTLLTKRLSVNLQPSDTFARLGGDEFVLIINAVETLESIEKLATNLLCLIKKPLVVAGYTLNIASSLGIALYPQHGKDADELLKNSDTAMYHAKKLGGDQIRFYSEDMNNKAIDQLKLEAQLHEALEKNELTLWYQPQYNTVTQQLTGVEALIRWQHPERGLLLPHYFIPLAEQTSLILPIGEWVLRQACLQNKRWQDCNFPPIRIAVNITVQQLCQPNLVQKIQTILEETELAPHYLELELSESTTMNPTVIHTLNALKKLGIEITLDDFGTGYSNLYQLKSLSLNRLKIDKSFVQNIEINKNDEVIIHAIIAMARSLNLDILAEGIETKEQLDFLKRHNCTNIQGFYFSKPLPAAEITTLFQNPEKIAQIINHESK